MLSLCALLLYVLALPSSLHAKSSTGDSVLVVLEHSLHRDNFSTFFNGLEDKGYDLTFRAPKDVKPAVIEYDEPQFSHVIIFAPETKIFAQDLSPQSLVTLLSKNVNLLIALSPKQTPLSSLAAEFSLILPPPGTPLISHFPERDTPRTVVPVRASPNAVLTKPSAVWFSGVPQALSLNPLLVPILRAPPESFASDSDRDADADSVIDASDKGGEGLWAGSSLSLVTGFQALGDARVTWVGGVELFSDEFANKDIAQGVKSDNAQVSAEIAAWTFREAGVLRIDNVAHHRVNETESPEMYTTNDQVVFTAHISKYDAETSSWKPYSGITDMQLEFTMLDPHIRTALPPVAGKPGEYSVTFRVPDRHGVFKFIIDYKRKGTTYLASSTVIPVVPPRHDGYPRFLSAAWPYYAGAISTSVGFLIFASIWLAGDESKKGKSAKTE